ncbi:hypothetical protein PIB30_072778 [Stylosanthes scabra]|uniref:Retrotransposon gag domain-containing protein n=1 Tax=Stylosanthes scabra TaxID=79078 RepID=A0ABU6QP54_9FABA|nr:hypothetical protein [Stylosanthes scabra]
MLRSNSDPDLPLFDLEIERTLRYARQVRRRAELENTLHSQAMRLASDNDSVYSSDSDFESRTSSSDIGRFTMGVVPRLTLKQLGGASTALENQPTKYSELNANFKLKSGLINLLPKFHGLPGEDLIKHLKNFEVFYATTKRTGEKKVLGEVLSTFKNQCNPEGDLLNHTTPWGNSAWAMIDASSGGALMKKTSEEAQVSGRHCLDVKGNQRRIAIISNPLEASARHFATKAG